MISVYVQALLSGSLREDGSVVVGSVHSRDVITAEHKKQRGELRIDDPEFKEAVEVYKKLKNTGLAIAMKEEK